MHVRKRIIPAYAGSTSLVMRSCCLGRDHPRIRGEHSISRRVDAKRSGSSPHTRGAPGVVGDRECGERIIPAYAGSTQDCSKRQGDGRGSSPHTRGAPMHGLGDGLTGRIIPAYAGSTPHAAASATRLQDHPRIRGEHTTFVPEIDVPDGSSPHTRGAHCAIHHSPRA